MDKITLFSDHEKLFVEKTGKDFSTLYKKYYPKLIYYTSKLCNDPQKTEDIATDSFMTAFEKIEKYDDEKAQFSTWLFTIAKNLALQAIKNDKKSSEEAKSNDSLNELVKKDDLSEMDDIEVQMKYNEINERNKEPEVYEDSIEEVEENGADKGKSKQKRIYSESEDDSDESESWDD